MSGEGYAAMGQGIADFVDDVVGYQGHDSHARSRRNLNLQYDQAQQHQPLIDSARFDARMAGFEKHGIHPLFGLGGSASQAPGFSMPGQSESGSHKTDGVANLLAILLAKQGEKQVKNDHLQQQAHASAMRVIENKMNNDNAIVTAKQVIRQGDLAKEAKTKGSAITHKVNMEKDTSSQGLVEIKPAEQLTHAVGDKSINPADVSLKRRLWTSNDQWLYIPNVQDLDSLMEEPLPALAMITALNPNMTTNQVKTQLQGLGYKFPEVEVRKGRKTILDWGRWLKITKDIPFKAQGRYVK